MISLDILAIALLASGAAAQFDQTPLIGLDSQDRVPGALRQELYLWL